MLSLLSAGVDHCTELNDRMHQGIKVPEGENYDVIRSVNKDTKPYPKPDESITLFVRTDLGGVFNKVKMQLFDFYPFAHAIDNRINELKQYERDQNAKAKQAVKF